MCGVASGATSAATDSTASFGSTSPEEGAAIPPPNKRRQLPSRKKVRRSCTTGSTPLAGVTGATPPRSTGARTAPGRVATAQRFRDSIAGAGGSATSAVALSGAREAIMACIAPGANVMVASPTTALTAAGGSGAASAATGAQLPQPRQRAQTQQAARLRRLPQPVQALGALLRTFRPLQRLQWQVRRPRRNRRLHLTYCRGPRRPSAATLSPYPISEVSSGISVSASSIGAEAAWLYFARDSPGRISNGGIPWAALRDERRREVALSMATLAIFGPAAMPPAATTPRIKGPAVVRIPGGWGCGDRRGGATVAAGVWHGGGTTGGASALRRGGGATSTTAGGGGSTTDGSMRRRRHRGGSCLLRQ